MSSKMEAIGIISRKFALLRGGLNERQRRQWAAAETLALGHGGLILVSRATGISQPTIRLLDRGMTFAGKSVTITFPL